MKSIKKIIGALVAIVLIMNISMPLSYAETAPEEECGYDYKPDYEELMNIWNNSEEKDQNTYKEAFEAAQTAHHNYIGCMFDFAEKQIMQSDGAQHSGTMAANLLNTGGIPVFSGLVDWMSPEQACLTSQEIKNVIEASEPKQMLAPVLQAHRDYREHLQRLGNWFTVDGIVTDEEGNELAGKSGQRQMALDFSTIERNRNLEIESSLLAIDLMFTSLKELRLAFIMHVHFQCSLKYLDKYRRALEELRNVIEPLPDQLEDASTS